MAEMQYYIQLFLVLLLSTIAIIQVILTRKKNKNKNHLTSPRAPLALPIIGHFYLLSKLPVHQNFHNLSIQYGPIMKLFLGYVPCVVVSSPEITKEFLKTHETSFSNRLVNHVVHYLSYGSKDFMFAPYGDYWKFMKKICMSELLGGKTLDQFNPLRQQETLRLLNVLKKKGEAGEAVDVGAELLTLTNRIMTRMTISRACCENDCDVEEIRKLVQDSSELAGKFNLSDFIWFFKNWDLQGFNKRLKEMMERFDTMIERVIREHQEDMIKKRNENGEGAHVKDILDILLEIQENENSKMKLTRENVKAFIFDMFLAGTDTSSTTIDWALAELINKQSTFGGNGKVNMEEKPSTILRRAHPLMCVPIPRFNFFSFNE
ncbi:hypothetical protein P8452_58660 [Trifolium repens]|nr:hypothetical protein P8452_58660 [Trifolium repens]